MIAKKWAGCEAEQSGEGRKGLTKLKKGYEGAVLRVCFPTFSTGDKSSRGALPLGVVHRSSPERDS